MIAKRVAHPEKRKTPTISDFCYSPVFQEISERRFPRLWTDFLIHGTILELHRGEDFDLLAANSGLKTTKEKHNRTRHFSCGVWKVQLCSSSKNSNHRHGGFRQNTYSFVSCPGAPAWNICCLNHQGAIVAMSFRHVHEHFCFFPPVILYICVHSCSWEHNVDCKILLDLPITSLWNE